MSCIFCEIAAERLRAEIVWRGEGAVAFLDHRPLFPGHVLLIPNRHLATMADLPAGEAGRFFEAGQRLERAVREGMGAEGSFIAINNHVSQSVPHLHLHIVPRRKGDGLKGFFWPRQKYESDEHMKGVAANIRTRL